MRTINIQTIQEITIQDIGKQTNTVKMK